MYYYHFTHYAGNDRVFVSDQQRGQAGDLLRIGGEYLLILGEDISWKEQHKKPWKLSLEPEIIFPGLLSSNSLTMLHRMVEYWFTTYKNVVPLWLGDIDELMKRSTTFQSKKKKSKKDVKHYPLVFDKKQCTVSTQQNLGQQLVVFPDLWTMNASLGENAHHTFGTDTLLLHSQTTAKQKAEAFRKIKSGQIGSVVCTYSQLFQDWHDLTRILLVDQHKRYYKSQQDPRYFVPTVVEEWAKLTGATLDKTGFQIA